MQRDPHVPVEMEISIVDAIVVSLIALLAIVFVWYCTKAITTVIAWIVKMTIVCTVLGLLAFLLLQLFSPEDKALIGSFVWESVSHLGSLSYTVIQLLSSAYTTVLAPTISYAYNLLAPQQ
ncbi:hypothetical protein Pelo_14868 [Pelomyxa schiedti]|nr:hypothetical protein Pelo_14868 [Pelomyxa schiedti]